MIEVAIHHHSLNPEWQTKLFNFSQFNLKTYRAIQYKISQPAQLAANTLNYYTANYLQ